jgi:hypothetical protein
VGYISWLEYKKVRGCRCPVKDSVYNKKLSEWPRNFNQETNLAECSEKDHQTFDSYLYIAHAAY